MQKDDILSTYTTTRKRRLCQWQLLGKTTAQGIVALLFGEYPQFVLLVVVQRTAILRIGVVCRQLILEHSL